MGKLHPLNALVLLASVCLFCSSPTYAEEKRYINIGTGGVTGVYYPAGTSICRLVNKHRKTHGIRCNVESTDGSTYNINAIRAGQLSMGLVQSDVQYDARHGTGTFKEVGPDSGLRAIFALHPEVFTVIAKTSSGIKHIDDLQGKRVSIGNPGSGQRATMEALMAAIGWNRDTFSLAAELKSAKLASALCSDKIDAMIFMVGHPSDAIKQATSSCNSVIVEIMSDKVDRLIAQNSNYQPAEIPGGLYQGNNHSVTSFGVGATLVTSDSTPDDIVYNTVKAVFDNFEEFKKLHPAFAKLNKKQMLTEGLSAPLHPGAIKYYKEVKLM
ncbi:MAG: TAXI family TRAP transporter solute-binding subunit [Halopseudomonas sp.]